MLETNPSRKNSGGAGQNVTRKAALWRQTALVGAALVAVASGMGPVACISDLPLPDCNETTEAPCSAGTGGAAGATGSAAGATAGGGTAGTGTNRAGGGGTPSMTGVGGEASVGSEGGAAGGEGGVAGGASVGVSGAGGETPTASCTNCVTPAALPAPCGTNPYSSPLSVSRGTPPYTWQIVPPVEHWQVTVDPTASDGSRATLNGQPAGTSSITVEVSDANGPFAQQTYAVLPRSSCWFAYTSLATSGAQLKLVDPILAPLAPALLTDNQGVYDFHFSPNGQYLAYRFGRDASDPTGAHLALVNLQSAPTEKALTAFGEDAVTAFAWSADSSVLAVAFTKGADTNLGGIRIDATAPDGFSALTPTPAFVQSDLYWVGSSQVAFHADLLPDVDNPGQFLDNPYNERTAFASSLGVTGFATPVTFDAMSYFPGVFVQPAGDGFFVVSPQDQYVYFNWLSAGQPHSSDSSPNFISPSGAYTAEVDASGTLQIFHTKGGVLSPLVAESGAGNCPKFLTWAKDRERIACVADVKVGTASHGEVRIFDLQGPPTTPVPFRVLDGYCTKDDSSPQCGGSEYDYTEESAASQARAFSPSGRWFAFTAPSIDGHDYLYWADLNSQPLQLKRKVAYTFFGATGETPTALAFSQDENFVLYQRGSFLVVEDLRTSQQTGTTSTTSAEPALSTTLPTGVSQATSACSEDFVSAPDRWCGNPDRSVSFVWAPDSRFAAYRAGDSVTVVDMTRVVAYSSQPLPAPTCSDECQNQFEFQPQAP